MSFTTRPSDGGIGSTYRRNSRRARRITSTLLASCVLVGLLVGTPAPVAAVTGSTTPQGAPAVCYSDSLDATHSVSPTVYGRFRAPAGSSTTFMASGAILPSYYIGFGRGEYTMHIRVLDPDTGAHLWEKWNYWGTGLVEGPPYPWQPFSGINIGTWNNTTGSTKSFVIQMWSQVSFAGEDLRWSVEMFNAGSATPDCAEPEPLSENFGVNAAMPGQCTRGTTARSVDTRTGNEHLQLPGLAVAGRGPGLDFSLAYNSLDTKYAGPIGFGWRHSYDMHLGPERNGTRTVYQETGATVTFNSNGAGAWSAPPRFEAKLTQNPDGTWTFERNRFERFVFDSTGRLIRVSDRNGYATTLVYSGGQLDYVEDVAGRRLDFTWYGGLVASITDPLAGPLGPRMLEFSYSNGNLTGYRDAGGGLWVLAYDGNRRVTSVRSPRHGDPAKAFEYHYDAQGRVDWEEDELNRRTTLHYDDPVAGATRVVSPDGDQRVDYYDAEGRCTKKTLAYGTPQATSTQFVYDPSTYMITARVDGRGKTWQYGYTDPANPRQRTWATDPAGRTVSLTYNALGQVASATDGEGVVTAFEYDVAGNLEKVTGALGTADQAVIDLVHGDPAHPEDVTSVIDARGHTWQATYAPGTGYRTSVTDPEGNRSTYEHNAIGWTTAAVSALGNVAGGTPAQYRSTAEYNRRGQVTRATNPLGQATVTAYDANGNVTSVTEPDLDVTTFTYSDADEVITRTQGAGTPASATTTYEYWPDGALKSWSRGEGAVWSYTYDAAGRRATATDPDGDVTAFAYDLNGNLRTVTQPGGNCTTTPATRCVTYTYDDVNQLTGVDYSDPATADVTVSYDRAGRRRFMTDGTGTSEWVWDRLGRLDRHTDGAGQLVDYTWDKAGNLDALLYPGQSVPLDYGYDRAGRMTSVTDWVGNTTSVGHDADGNQTSLTYPADTAMSQAAAYDRADRRASVQWNHAGRGQLGRVTYSRDPDGLVTGGTTTGVPAGDSAFGYDARDQLSTAGGRSFQYDSRGNPTALPEAAQTFDLDSELTSTQRSITLAGTASTYDTTAPAVSLNLPAGIAAHDQILLVATMPAAQAVTEAAAGYTEVTQQQGGASRSVLYRRTAAGGETTARVGFSGDGLYQKSLMAVLYRGVDPVNPVADHRSAATPGPAASVTVEGVTAARPGTRLVMVESTTDSLLYGWRQPAGMQERVWSTMHDLASSLGDQTLAAAGPTGPRTATYAGSFAQHRPLVGILLALNPEPPHTFTYDRRGNRTSRTTPFGTTDYDYDQANRLVGVDGAVSYGYDGEGLRTAASTSAGTRKFTWSRSGSLPLMLTEGPVGAGGVPVPDKAVSYVYGPGGRLLTRIDPRPDITLVGARGTAGPALGHTLTAELPPGIAADDQILLAATYDEGYSVGTPAGYTEVGTWVGPWSRMTLWRRTATGGESSVTFDSPAVKVATAAVYRGVDPGNPIVDSDAGTSMESSVTLPPLDGAQPGDRMAAFTGAVVLPPAATGWAAPAGMTVTASLQTLGSSALTADQALAAPGPTGYRTFSHASSASLVAAGVVLRRAGHPERWHHLDELGSTRLVTDQVGRTVGTATYDSYGTLRGSTGERSNIGFAGEYHDPTTGLVYLRARWYDPATAQFLSRDPLVDQTGEPYAYAGNDPVNATDPTGLCPICVAVGVGAATGAATELGIQMLANLIQGCGALDNINWRVVAMGAVVGGATGGLAKWVSGLRIAPRAAGLADDAARMGDDIVGSTHNTLRPTQDWLNPAQVDDYAARLRAGEQLRPISVQRLPDGRQFILDGHHRYVASQRTGIPIEIRYIDGPGPIGLSDWSKVRYGGG